MELSITQAQINNYLSGLDFNNIVVKKIFTSLQLLKREFFNNTVALLIDGRLTLNDLNTISINNITISNLIDSILASPANINEKTIFYKTNVVDNYPNFNAFLNTLRLNTSAYIARKNISAVSISKEILVDSTGLNPSIFTSLQKAKNVYDTFKSSITLSTNYNLINSSSFLFTDTLLKIADHQYQLTFLPSNNIYSLYINNSLVDSSFYNVTADVLTIDNSITITESTYVLLQYTTSESSLSVSLSSVYLTLLNELNQYKLIFNKTLLPLNLGYNNTFSGFLLREFTLINSTLLSINVNTDTTLKNNSHLPYINLRDNIRYLTNEMAVDYDTDIDKTGVYTVTRLIRNNNWSRLNNISDPNIFINELSKLVFIRITVPNWIGSGYFPSTYLENEYKNLNIILKYLYSLKITLKDFLTVIQDTIYDYAN